MEAFSCGLVPVISDNPRSATGQFALGPRNLFRSGDPSSLAERIDGWIDDPAALGAASETYARYAEALRGRPERQGDREGLCEGTPRARGANRIRRPDVPAVVERLLLQDLHSGHVPLDALGPRRPHEGRAPAPALRRHAHGVQPRAPARQRHGGDRGVPAPTDLHLGARRPRNRGTGGSCDCWRGLAVPTPPAAATVSSPNWSSSSPRERACTSSPGGAGALRHEPARLQARRVPPRRPGPGAGRAALDPVHPADPARSVANPRWCWSSASPSTRRRPTLAWTAAREWNSHGAACTSSSPARRREALAPIAPDAETTEGLPDRPATQPVVQRRVVDDVARPTPSSMSSCANVRRRSRSAPKISRILALVVLDGPRRDVPALGDLLVGPALVELVERVLQRLGQPHVAAARDRLSQGLVQDVVHDGAVPPDLVHRAGQQRLVIRCTC